MSGRIGVLSDTHLPKGSYRLPDAMLRAFEGVDAILHGGDVIDIDYHSPLPSIAPVYVVAGNNDPPEMGVLMHRPCIRLIVSCSVTATYRIVR